MNLTPRQREVFAAIAETGSQKDAAARLGISLHCVKTHTTNAYARLGTSGYIETWRALGWLQVPKEVA